jgi:hypothetical protein
MKSAIVSNFLLAIIFLSASLLVGCRQTSPAIPQSGIIGKWRNAEGTYAVEFLPTGECSARSSQTGHGTLGGPCTYTVDNDEITLRWHFPDGSTATDAPNASAKWRYSLSGDTLNVAVFGNAMTLHRVH